MQITPGALDEAKSGHGKIDRSRLPAIPLPRNDPPAETARLWLGPALALVGAFGFSGKSIFAKLAYAASTSIDAVTVLTFRMLFSLPFLGLMLWMARRSDETQQTRIVMSRRDWALMTGLGFIGYFLSSFLDFWGLEYISASLERLILFLNPTIVVILSAIIFRKPVTRWTAAALVLSYSGILLVFAHDFHVMPETRALLIGGGLVFASAVSYAIYLVGNGGLIARLGAPRFTAYGMGVSSIFVISQFLLIRPLSSLQQPAAVYWHMAGIAVFSTVLPIWITNEAIRMIGSSRVALIGTIGPILTIGLGSMFLGESVTLVQIAGAVLVIAGVGVVTLKR
nr:drug/metabolite transporter (DMT) superfamily permease [uncultured bacterium]